MNSIRPHKFPYTDLERRDHRPARIPGGQGQSGTGVKKQGQLTVRRSLNASRRDLSNARCAARSSAVQFLTRFFLAIADDELPAAAASEGLRDESDVESGDDIAVVF